MNESIKLKSKLRGAFFGLALGDALGFPFRGRSRQFLSAQRDILRSAASAGFPAHPSGHHPPGQISDDTQTALAVMSAIVEAGRVDGQIISEHFIPLWRDHLVVDRTAASTEAIEKLIKGRAGIEDSGLLAGRAEADALPRSVPIGMVCHDATDQIPICIAPVVSMTHRDPLVLATSAALAAAISCLMTTADIILGKLLDCMAQAAGRFHGEAAERILDFPRILSLTEYRALEQFELASVNSGNDPMASFNAGIPDHCSFVFSAAVYYFLRTPYDFEKTITASLRAGGETSTLCALTGSLSGAFLGDEALPAELIDRLPEKCSLQAQFEAFLACCERPSPAPCETTPT